WNRLRLVVETDFEDPALSGRTVTPIRHPRVTNDHEFAVGRDRTIDRQQSEIGDQLRTGDVSRSRLHQIRAPEFSSRFAGDERAARPALRSEPATASRGAVEAKPTGALM